MNFPLTDFIPAAAEVFLLAMACVVLVVDLFLGRPLPTAVPIFCSDECGQGSANKQPMASGRAWPHLARKGTETACPL